MRHFAFNAFHTLLVMAVGRVAGEKNALASRGSTVPPWARASGCRGARGRSAMPCTYMVVVAETVKRNEEGVPTSAVRMAVAD